MPPRSKDLASLRTFAALHAAAHAKAATPRPHAACHCRAERCAAHDDTRVHCTSAAAMILRHDPALGRVWSVEEVCTACAPLIPHARILTRSVTPQRGTTRPPAATAPPLPAVPAGFSSPAPPAGSDPHPRRTGPAPRRPRGGGAR